MTTEASKVEVTPQASVNTTRHANEEPGMREYALKMEAELRGEKPAAATVKEEPISPSTTLGRLSSISSRLTSRR